MLLNVAARCGKDSREYGKAGGVLTSERKKSTRKARITTPKPPTTAPAELANDQTLPVMNLNESSNGKEIKIASMNGNGNGKSLAV
jgi:hypothetical protein